MDLNRLPWMNLSHRPLRTAALLVLTFFLSFVIFAGSMAVVSLQNGLGTLENRLGADIIVVPNTAKRKVDPKTMILDGTPGYFYMEREKMVLISHIEGVEKVSPQIFLASLSASCCSVPVQIIGFEPETDFIIQPWIRESYGRETCPWRCGGGLGGQCGRRRYDPFLQQRLPHCSETGGDRHGA